MSFKQMVVWCYVNYFVGGDAKESHLMDGKLDLLAEVHCWEVGKPNDRGESVKRVQGNVRDEGRQRGQCGGRMSCTDDWKTGVTPGLFSTCSSGDHTYYSMRGGEDVFNKIIEKNH